MSIPNQIEQMQAKNTENTVYFYPDKLKISYTSLENFKNYLTEIFDQDIRLEEKLKQCNTFLNIILKELYKKGILNEDHTMVITDLIANRDAFLEATRAAYNETIKSKITITRPNKVKIIKRQILTALFIKKEHNLKDFLSILKGKGEIYSNILGHNINLEKHKNIKFRATKELEQYIVNILTRTALLSQGCSVFTLRLYIDMIIELVIWYSRGLALTKNKEEADPNTLSASIKLVDNHYITNPDFIKMLQGKFIGYIIKVLN